jgi:PiT family inorganic phosphate transporter
LEQATNHEVEFVTTRALSLFVDVSNGIAPLVQIMAYVREGHAENGVGEHSTVPLSLLILGGSAILLGLTLFGYRVMQTVGFAIAKLDFATGLAAQTAAALCVLAATAAGLPVSTTQILVAAVAGAAYSQGTSIQGRTVWRILLAWVLTIPVSAFVSVAVHWIVH